MFACQPPLRCLVSHTCMSRHVSLLIVISLSVCICCALLGVVFVSFPALRGGFLLHLLPPVLLHRIFSLSFRLCGCLAFFCASVLLVGVLASFFFVSVCLACSGLSPQFSATLLSPLCLGVPPVVPCRLASRRVLCVHEATSSALPVSTPFLGLGYFARRPK